MSGFHEIRFPDTIALDAVGGPNFDTTVIITANGTERRNVNWSQSRGRWDVGSNIKDRAGFEQLIAFFRARQGRAYGFRFKDWSDYEALASVIGTGDGAQLTFQLVKKYTSGTIDSTRIISKPVAGTVKIYLDGVEATTGWTVNTATGVVTFGTAPAVGVVVTADFEFDVPVRFDTDVMNFNLSFIDFGNWPNVPVVEVRV